MRRAPVESFAFPALFAGSHDNNKGVHLIYLGIFLVVAVCGISGLWWSQRQQRMHLRTVGDFRTSLERISSHNVVVPRGPRERVEAPRKPRGKRRPEPLDPATREAAKRRLARRRAARV